MNGQNFHEYLKRPSMLFELNLNELRLLLEEYPYCQNLHYLLAKKAQMENLPEQAKYTSNAAVYSPDRAFLFMKMQNIDHNKENKIKKADPILEIEALNINLPEEEKTKEIETSPPLISFEVEATAEEAVELPPEKPVTADGPEKVKVSAERVTDNVPEPETASPETKPAKLVSPEKPETKELSVLDQILSQGGLLEKPEDTVEEDITSELITKPAPEISRRVQKIIRMESVRSKNPENNPDLPKDLSMPDVVNEKKVMEKPEEKVVMEVVEHKFDKKHEMPAKDKPSVELEKKIPLKTVESPETKPTEAVPEHKECPSFEDGPRLNPCNNKHTIEDVKKKKKKVDSPKKRKKDKIKKPKKLKAQKEKAKNEKAKKKAAKAAKAKKKKSDLKKFAEKSVLAYDDIASETLAKLLVQQGSPKAAIEIYKRLCILNGDKTSQYKKMIKKLKKG